MTGRSLLRRLLALPRLQDRYEDPQLVPLGARPVLEAVADLVAGAGDDGGYRVDQEADGARSLLQVVARRVRAVGHEAEVHSHMEALMRAGLLVLTDDGALVLPVPSRAARTERAGDKASSNRRNSQYSVGPRRQGETDAEFAERKAAKRSAVDARLRAQGTLLMPYAGGRGEANRSQAGTDLASDLEATEEAIRDVSSVPGLASRTGQQSTAAAVAADLEASRNPATAAATDARVASELASREAKPEKPNGSASEEAIELARRASGQFGWDPVHAAAAPAIMQGYLDAGYSVDQVRGVLADKVGVTCNGARYLVRPLERLTPAREAGRQPLTAADQVALPPVPEVVAGDAEWSTLPRTHQVEIGRVLEVLAMPASGERDRLLASCRKIRVKGVASVAARHPERAEELGFEPERLAG